MVRDQVIQLLQHVSVLAERSGLEVEKLLQRGERVDKAALSHAVETTEMLVAIRKMLEKNAQRAPPNHQAAKALDPLAQFRGGQKSQLPTKP